MKTILFKLSGPLQSWGTQSHFETRQTDRYPSKSAVIGIIAASLGYRRDEDKKIQQLNDLDFGVRVDQTGESLRDYQTVKDYKKNGKVDRTDDAGRNEWEEALCVLAMGHEQHELTRAGEERHKQAYFQPCLGRRPGPWTADLCIGRKHQSVVEK